MHLAVPFSSTVVFIPKKQIQRVCAIDLGINTTATASILTSDGTVVARHFFHRAADIDRRDKGLAQIRRKARQTTGATGVLSTGFCASQYRKAANRNREMARTLSRQIVMFAQVYGAQAIVLEQLHGFRPRGGRGTSTLRQRFHGWLHRQLAQHVQARAEEAGLRTEYVHPAGTSKYAFDGSGVVRRDPTNRSLATFPTGKQYHADLSASYNIGARYFARILGVTVRKNNACGVGQRSRTQPRTPVTLSTLWHAHRRSAGECEAATTPSHG